jgi:cysteinyl-tRNA synthetase
MRAFCYFRTARLSAAIFCHSNAFLQIKGKRYSSSCLQFIAVRDVACKISHFHTEEGKDWA